MGYWLKVIFFTIVPLVLLYFISLPYYDSSDDADTGFKNTLFNTTLFLVPIGLSVLHFFLARQKKSAQFPVKAIFVILAFSFFVESLGGMYRNSFRWMYPPSYESFTREWLSVGFCIGLLFAVRVYLALRKQTQ